MSLKQGDLRKILVDRATVVAMIHAAREEPGKKGFLLDIIEEGEGGVTRIPFAVDRVIYESPDVLLYEGETVEGKIRAKILVFKGEILDRELGSILVA